MLFVILAKPQHIVVKYSHHLHGSRSQLDTSVWLQLSILQGAALYSEQIILVDDMQNIASTHIHLNEHTLTCLISPIPNEQLSLC